MGELTPPASYFDESTANIRIVAVEGSEQWFASPFADFRKILSKFFATFE